MSFKIDSLIFYISDSVKKINSYYLQLGKEKKVDDNRRLLGLFITGKFQQYRFFKKPSTEIKNYIVDLTNFSGYFINDASEIRKYDFMLSYSYKYDIIFIHYILKYKYLPPKMKTRRLQHERYYIRKGQNYIE